MSRSLHLARPHSPSDPEPWPSYEPREVVWVSGTGLEQCPPQAELGLSHCYGYCSSLVLFWVLLLLQVQRVFLAVRSRVESQFAPVHVPSLWRSDQKYSLSQRPLGMVHHLLPFRIAIHVIRRLEGLRACLSRRWEPHALDSADVLEVFPGSRRELDVKSEEQHETLVLREAY